MIKRMMTAAEVGERIGMDRRRVHEYSQRFGIGESVVCPSTGRILGRYYSGSDLAKLKKYAGRPVGRPKQAS